MKTIVLLTISNMFMTFAWYGHLKFRETPLPRVILISWFIAFFEYCFQVPANRIGYSQFSAAELKTIQEVITLLVFAVFSILYLGEELRWNDLVGFLCLIAAVFFVFHPW
jgi:uncharacterized protein (DUF486 family)